MQRINSDDAPCQRQRRQKFLHDWNLMLFFSYGDVTKEQIAKLFIGA